MIVLGTNWGPTGEYQPFPPVTCHLSVTGTVLMTAEKSEYAYLCQ